MIILQPTRSLLSSGDQCTLDLPFAETKSLVARVGPTPTFTRASSATFVDSDGLVKLVSSNTPRFQHNPITGICEGLLLEGTKTNFARYSEELILDRGWTSGGLISTLSNVTGPNGGAVYELRESPTTTIQTFANTGGTTGTAATSVTSGTIYTSSIFLKKIEGSVNWVQITHGQTGFGQSQYLNVNLSTGTRGNFAGGAGTITPYPNGWYRVSWTTTATVTTSTTLNVIVVGIQNTNGTVRIPSYLGNSANKFLATMAQFEAGTRNVSSYIPTTSTSVIRSADVCSITGSDFTSMYNSAAGSIYTEAIFTEPNTSTSAQLLFDINDGSATDRLRYFRGNTGVAGFINTVNNVNVVNINGSAALSPGKHKFSAAFSLNNFAFSVNGALIGTDTATSMPTSPTTLTIGDSSAGAVRIPLNGTILSLRYYRRRNSIPKIQALSL